MKRQRLPRKATAPAAASAPAGVWPPPARELTPARALAVPLAAIAVMLGLTFGFEGGNAYFVRTFLAAAALLVVWAGALYVGLRRGTRKAKLAIGVYKHHWVQACTQIVLYAWWGWQVRLVYAFFPLIIAQLAFAYAVDSLLTWSRRDTYSLGFGPWPVILSMNLFLWFRPQWFYFQLAMILVGFLVKELVKWNRDGRYRHIFNPSSFPLAAASLVLILTHGSDITFGNFIANTQFDPPHIYLVIFLASLPGQLFFGVVRMTLASVLTAYAIGLVYLHTTGTYLFFDAFIPVPVFLGMHLIMTDPSTSPRSESGRILFGVLYALGTTALFVMLSRRGIPTFYDKLLPIPFMNLMVRAIDRLAEARPWTYLDPARIGRNLTPFRRNLAYVSVWAVAFTGMSSVRALGDRHPGQYLPFWREACSAGSDRACRYSAYLVDAYCHNGSGWACNEDGIQIARSGRPATAAFERGCELGFPLACENAKRSGADTEPMARSGPRPADLPIVLRGTKPPLRERDPDKLNALACWEGWPGACEGRLEETTP
jgi:hypothetical protein